MAGRKKRDRDAPRKCVRCDGDVERYSKLGVGNRRGLIVAMVAARAADESRVAREERDYYRAEADRLARELDQLRDDIRAAARCEPAALDRIASGLRVA